MQQQAADKDGCRVCRLLDAIPPTWTSGEYHHCVVVPVQTIETWLMCIKGHSFNAPSPEQYYNRAAMKRQFFGRAGLPVRVHTQLAMAELQKPEALDILRERLSFQHFENQLTTWS